MIHRDRAYMVGVQVFNKMSKKIEVNAVQDVDGDMG